MRGTLGKMRGTLRGRKKALPVGAMPFEICVGLWLLKPHSITDLGLERGDAFGYRFPKRRIPLRVVELTSEERPTNAWQ